MTVRLCVSKFRTHRRTYRWCVARVTFAQMVDAIEAGVLPAIPDVLDGEYLLAADRRGNVGAVMIASVEGETFHISVEFLRRHESKWEAVGGSRAQRRWMVRVLCVALA